MSVFDRIRRWISGDKAEDAADDIEEGVTGNTIDLEQLADKDGNIPRYFIETPLGSFPATHFLITDYGLEFLYDGVLSVYFSATQCIVHDFNSGVKGEDFDNIKKEIAKRREEYQQKIEERLKSQWSGITSTRPDSCVEVT